MELQGKTAFITGGASGLGLATAKNFVKAGARVFLYDLNAEALEAAAAEFGESAAWHAGDVADEDAVKAARKRCELWCATHGIEVTDVDHGGDRQGPSRDKVRQAVAKQSTEDDK